MVGKTSLSKSILSLSNVKIIFIWLSKTKYKVYGSVELISFNIKDIVELLSSKIFSKLNIKLISLSLLFESL